MKINQHNYEHYFLMYIDNELSEQAQAAVTEFIAQNPDFAKELQDLQKTKINPSTIVFEDKLSLYNLSAQDEQCINYLDNEMPLLEKNAFEKSLTNNSLLSAALKEWQKTILIKEAANEIQPAFKNSLYKKEAIIKPIWSGISVKQWASVAAILLLVISISIYQQNNNKNNFKSIAQLDKDPLQPSSKMIDNDHKASQTNSKNTNSTNAVGIGHFPTNHPLVKNSNQYQANILHNKITKNIPLQITQEETPLEKISYAAHNEIAANSQVQPTENNHIHSTPETYTPISKAFISDAQDEISNTITAANPNQIQYINIDTDEEERVIHIANLEIDGAKFRELSRKITTLFKINKPENEKYK